MEEKENKQEVNNIPSENNNKETQFTEEQLQALKNYLQSDVDNLQKKEKQAFKARTELQKEQLEKDEKEKAIQENYKKAVSFMSNIKNYIKEKEAFLPKAVLQDAFVNYYENLEPEEAQRLLKVDLATHFFEDQNNIALLDARDNNIINSWINSEDKQTNIEDIHLIFERALHLKQQVENIKIAQNNPYSSSGRNQERGVKAILTWNRGNNNQ